MSWYISISKLFQWIKTHFLALPSPISLGFFWNFGSLLGVVLLVQMMSGVFLSMTYDNSVTLAYETCERVLRELSGGWMMRMTHTNGASLFMFLIYLHFGKGLYYSSYVFKSVWLLGVTILLVSMFTAFTGYVLLWAQMSYWALKVITSLLSVGQETGLHLLNLVWGSYFLGAPTLFRLYSVHFFLPFVILFLVVMHLWQLHVNGSSNPSGLPLSRERCKFYSLYFFKDMVTPCIVYFMFVGLVSYSPWVFSDPGNFMEAESLVTPLHIKPEWYFLFAYAILRSMPTKMGGVIAMGLSVTIYYVLPYLPKPFYFKGNYFNPVGKLVFVTFVFSVLSLTWLGAQPVEIHFTSACQMVMYLYFLSLMFSWIMSITWSKAT